MRVYEFIYVQIYDAGQCKNLKLIAIYVFIYKQIYAKFLTLGFRFDGDHAHVEEPALNMYMYLLCMHISYPGF